MDRGLPVEEPGGLQSMDFSRQEYWSGQPIPSSRGIFPAQGMNLLSPALQEDSLPSEPPGKPYATLRLCYCGEGAWT